jgi:hypothetical protein
LSAFNQRFEREAAAGQHCLEMRDVLVEARLSVPVVFGNDVVGQAEGL